MVGETLRYVALDRTGEWIALLGFASPALSCRPRDRFIGWSSELQSRRLRFVASNQRLCILPAGHSPNTASAVLSQTLKRLSADWVDVWGHPILLVETFVDPSRHIGTCYLASSFLRLGQSAGYGRKSGRYVAHGQVKDVYVRALHPRSVEVLASAFEHPLLAANPGSTVAAVDFNTADLDSLIERIELITDPRDPRGVRHNFASTLVLVACGTLAGNKSLVALSEWCQACSQEALARLNARISPSTGLRIPPSYATIRRATMAVDSGEFDSVINTWAAQQADRRQRKQLDAKAAADRSNSGSKDAGNPKDAGGSTGRGADLVGVAVDGKAVRGAKRADGTRVQLLAALRHDTGMVIGQASVENHKTSEIRAFAPLLEGIKFAGRVVTADAMHTQKNAAKLVTRKGGHYLFGVKRNQPRLWNAAVEAGDKIDLDRPEFETSSRGHGRIDRHRVWTAPVGATTRFPHASRFVIVERESSTLSDVSVSIETRFYVTDLTETAACAQHLLRLVRGHWATRSLHWIRDNTFDEDRSQVRTGTLPRVLATLRNLAIGMIRHATARTVNIAAATRQLARQPDLTLDLLGIPPLLCK